MQRIETVKEGDNVYDINTTIVVINYAKAAEPDWCSSSLVANSSEHSCVYSFFPLYSYLFSFVPIVEAEIWSLDLGRLYCLQPRGRSSSSSDCLQFGGSLCNIAAQKLWLNIQ